MAGWLEGLGRDLRYAVRLLRRQGTLTAAVVGTLALGIGANTAVFTVVDAVLLSPLPYGEPERLAAVWESSVEREAPRNEVSMPNFLDWRDATHAFESLGAYAWSSMNLTGPGGAERVQGIAVTPGLLAAHAVEPALGRTFLAEDGGESRPDEQSVVLAWDLWQRRMGGRSDVLGEALLVNGEPRTIVGVMPAGFELPVDSGAEIWSTLYTSARLDESRTSRYLYVIGRLAPGVSAGDAQAELEVLSRRLAADHPEANGGWSAAVVPLHDEVVGESARAFWILAATSLFVLLIAAANVSGLLLTGFQARRDELGVRAALGAGTGRLVRQLLASGAVLGLAGALPGALFAAGGVWVLLRLSPRFVPRLDEISFAGRALAFCAAVSLVAALASSLPPALRVVRSSRRSALVDGVRGGSPAPATLRGGLVIAQTALVLALLLGCGLTLRSLLALRAVDPGFEPDGVVLAELLLPRSAYPDDERVRQVQEALLERLAALPGVRSVGAASHVPLAGGNMSTDFDFVGPRSDPSLEKEVNFRVVSPGYFRTLEIPLRAGRDISWEDRASTPGVAVISEAMAQRHFPGRRAVGERLRIGEDPPLEVEIVGVVGDVRHWALDRAPEPELYLSYLQYRYGHARIVLKSDLAPSAVAGSLRREMERLDPDQPVYGVAPLEDTYRGALSRADLLAGLLGLFAGVSIALAAIGIAGVVAATTQQRRREIGVRLALGARRAEILTLVLRRTGALLAAGLLAGLLLGTGVARALDGLLYEVDPADPTTYAMAVGFLVLAGVGAGWIPARRALRIDPARVLREEAGA